MNLLRTRRLSAWIALCVMALAALAPTVSRALVWGAAPSGPSWIAVCSASGMQWVPLDAAATVAPAVSGTPGDGPPSAGHPLDPCPFCLLGADRLGPPPAPPATFRGPGDPVAPVIRPAPLLRSLASLAAHARGPPLHTAPSFVA